MAGIARRPASGEAGCSPERALEGRRPSSLSWRVPPGSGSPRRPRAPRRSLRRGRRTADRPRRGTGSRGGTDPSAARRPRASRARAGTHLVRARTPGGAGRSGVRGVAVRSSGRCDPARAVVTSARAPASAAALGNRRGRAARGDGHAPAVSRRHDARDRSPCGASGRTTRCAGRRAGGARHRARGKRLPSYGYARSSAPAIEQTRCTKARSSSRPPRPPPGHCHRTRRCSPAATRRATAHTPSTASSTTAYPTLAEVLERNGYETFCITANAWISDGLGPDARLRLAGRIAAQPGRRGNRLQLHPPASRSAGPPGCRQGGRAGCRELRGLGRRSGRARARRPAFVFLNFIEAHFPYHQLPSRLSVPKFTDARLRASCADQRRSAGRAVRRAPTADRGSGRADTRDVRRRRALHQRTAVAGRRSAARPRHTRRNGARRAGGSR